MEPWRFISHFLKEGKGETKSKGHFCLLEHQSSCAWLARNCWNNEIVYGFTQPWKVSIHFMVPTLSLRGKFMRDWQDNGCGGGLFSQANALLCSWYLFVIINLELVMNERKSQLSIQWNWTWMWRNHNFLSSRLV